MVVSAHKPIEVKHTYSILVNHCVCIIHLFGDPYIYKSNLVPIMCDCILVEFTDAHIIVDVHILISNDTIYSCRCMPRAIKSKACQFGPFHLRNDAKSRSDWFNNRRQNHSIMSVWVKIFYDKESQLFINWLFRFRRLNRKKVLH